MAAPSEIRSLLKDVSLYGAVTVNKKKLLWMINNWKQDRPSAWVELLAHWTALEEDETTLSGIEAGEMVVLAKSPSDLEQVLDWANT